MMMLMMMLTNMRGPGGLGRNDLHEQVRNMTFEEKRVEIWFERYPHMNHAMFDDGATVWYFARIKSLTICGGLKTFTRYSPDKSLRKRKLTISMWLCISGTAAAGSWLDGCTDSCRCKTILIKG